MSEARSLRDIREDLHSSEAGPAKLGPGKATGLTQAIEKLACAMAEQKAWMGPKKAAEFLDMRYDEFRKIAPRLPRHPIPRDDGYVGPRARYRYYAPDLTEWLMKQ